MLKTADMLSDWRLSPHSAHGGKLKPSLTRVEIAVLLVTIVAIGNLSAAVIGIIAGPRTYEARVELLAGPDPFADEVLVLDPRLVAGVAEFYALLATSTSVLQQAIDRLGLDVSASDLSTRVRPETVIGSPFFAVRVSDTNPELAASIANEIAAVLSSARTGVLAGPQALQIVESAIPPSASSSLPRLLSASVAIVVVIVIGLTVIILPPDSGRGS